MPNALATSFVKSGVIAFLAIAGMIRDSMVDNPGVAMTVAALIIVVVIVWWPERRLY